MAEARLRLVPKQNVDRVPIYVQIQLNGKATEGVEVVVALTASGTLEQGSATKIQNLRTDEYGIVALTWWLGPFKATAGWLFANTDESNAIIRIHEGKHPLEAHVY